MSKKAMSRTSKYASYRKQISKMKDVEVGIDSTQFQAATIKEAKKSQVNTTTSLNADMILKEIERREDPTGEVKLLRERERRIKTLVQIVTITLSSGLVLTLLIILFIFLYRSLS